MNWVDWAIVSLLFISTCVGFVRGFFKELISFAAWVGGIWLAFSFSEILGSFFSPWVRSQEVCYLIAWVLIFFAVMVSGMILSRFVNLLISATGLRLGDRILGLVFGVARGAVVVIVGLTLVLWFGTVGQESVSASRFSSHFQPMVAWLHRRMPEYHQLSFFKNFNRESLSEFD